MSLTDKTALALSAAAVIAVEHKLVLGRIGISSVTSTEGDAFVTVLQEPRSAKTLADLEHHMRVELAGWLAVNILAEDRETMFVQNAQRARRLADDMVAFGDQRDAMAILKDVLTAVHDMVVAKEGTILKLAHVLMREGAIDGDTAQRIIIGS